MTDQPATSRNRNHVKRLVLLGLGWLLIALTPLVGPIPGPGGIVVFAAGATLVLRNSYWAKKQYVKIERRWPSEL